MLYTNPSFLWIIDMAKDNKYTFYPILDDDLTASTIRDFKEDPEFARMYLDSEIKEYNKTGDIQYILKTLEMIVRALGITKFAETNNINRSTLNNVFRNKHSPETSTLNSILEPLGYRASITFNKI